MTVTVVVEGDTDLPIVRKLVSDAGLEISAEIDCRGKDQLDEDLPGFNLAAKGSPWLVLRDLDEDATCAGEFLNALKFRPSPWMCFRLAVRELESWLLADSEGIATFFGIAQGAVPVDPDREVDPTQTLVTLVRRFSRPRIKRAMVPRPGSSVSVGPLYEATIIRFAETCWNLDRACAHSPSLQRTRERLRSFAARWRRYVGA